MNTTTTATPTAPTDEQLSAHVERIVHKLMKNTRRFADEDAAIAPRGLIGPISRSEYMSLSVPEREAYIEATLREQTLARLLARAAAAAKAALAEEEAAPAPEQPAPVEAAPVEAAPVETEQPAPSSTPRAPRVSRYSVSCACGCGVMLRASSPRPVLAYCPAGREEVEAKARARAAAARRRAEEQQLAARVGSLEG